MTNFTIRCRSTKFWTRKKFKGTNALRGKVNAIRVPIEKKGSARWLDNLARSPYPQPGHIAGWGGRKGGDLLT